MLHGFAEDYNKIIMNVRQELILLRSNTDLNSILTNKTDEKPKIVLTKIFWKVPHISVGDVEKYKLLGYIDSGKYLDITFRSWELQEYPLLQETMKHTWAVKTTSQLEKSRFYTVLLPSWIVAIMVSEDEDEVFPPPNDQQWRRPGTTASDQSPPGAERDTRGWRRGTFSSSEHQREPRRMDALADPRYPAMYREGFRTGYLTGYGLLDLPVPHGTR
ncbi:hypothetical protein NQ318_023590 [Aromia moschata]|uniref:Double jelly roll-like domain-containing protein n=1 Tax=Aromia moschata TaxID=1265417 RepID=A0AAV8YS28_9CUCU|nr:hypothetical protein NQ318_023590 [Aromia moschata]